MWKQKVLCFIVYSLTYEAVVWKWEQAKYLPCLFLFLLRYIRKSITEKSRTANKITGINPININCNWPASSLIRVGLILTVNISVVTAANMLGTVASPSLLPMSVGMSADSSVSSISVGTHTKLRLSWRQS